MRLTGGKGDMPKAVIIGIGHKANQSLDHRRGVY